MHIIFVVKNITQNAVLCLRLWQNFGLVYNLSYQQKSSFLRGYCIASLILSSNVKVSILLLKGTILTDLYGVYRCITEWSHCEWDWSQIVNSDEPRS